MKQLSVEIEARELAEDVKRDKGDMMEKIKDMSGRLAKIEKTGQLQIKQTAEVRSECNTAGILSCFVVQWRESVKAQLAELEGGVNASSCVAASEAAQ